MKRLVTLALFVLFVLPCWSQGRTLLYTGNGWRQINIPSGQAPDNTPPASIDHVVISQSLSRLSTVTISTNAGDSLRIGGGDNSFCRSMHISNTTVIFMDSVLSDVGPPINVYTNNRGYVVIDSGAVLEKGRFFLYGGDPAIKDLRVENSKFGNQTTHNTDWADIYMQDSGRASFINSSFEGIALETKLHESTGGLYAQNSTFSATRFILGDNTTDSFLNSSIDLDQNNYDLTFLIGRNAHFVSENAKIQSRNGIGVLNFTSSGSVFNGDITFWYINFRQEDAANPLPNIINGNVVMVEEPGCGISGDVRIAGDFINKMPAAGFDMYRSDLFVNDKNVFTIGGIKNFGDKVSITNCADDFCHYKIEFYGSRNSNIDWSIGFPADTLIINKNNCAKVTSTNALYVAGETRIVSGQLSLEPNDTVPYKLVCAGDVKISAGGGIFLGKNAKGDVANMAIKGTLDDHNTGPADSTCAGLSNPYNGKIDFFSDTTNNGNTDTTSTSNPDSVSNVHTDSLTHFSASYFNKAVTLTWTMKKQSRTKSFTIEKSFDQGVFEPVTTVMAAPDLPTENDYTYVDNTTLKKINYYRLKITDESAGFYYSDTISVSGPDERIVLLYPNPVSDQVFLRPGTITGNAVVKIVDSKGAVIKILSLSIGTADIPINVSQLQPGNYLVSIRAGEMVEMVRFVKE